MEPAKPIVAEKPKRHIRLGMLAEGGLGLAFALACVGMDIYNNAVFGFEQSPAIAGLFIIGGVGLAYLPGLVKSWTDVQAILLVVVCGVMTLFAGYQNHMASQKNHALANSATTERYNAAQDAIKAADKAYREAKSEAAGIAEQSGYDELKIAYDAASKLYEDNKALCGPICRDARDQVKLLPDRMGKAKAKADAQKRADEAWARMEREKQAAPAQAKASGVTEQEEQVMAILLLLLSVVGATMAHRSYATLRGAFVEAPAPKPVRVAAKKAVSVVEMGQKEKLDACLATCTAEASDGPLVGSDKFRVMVADYWRAHHNGEPVPSQKAIGQAMAARYKRGKDPKSGKIGYHARIDYKLSLVGKAA